MTRQGPLLVALALAGFVTALDNSIVNVAVPTMQRDLHATVPELEWIVSSYVLSFAGLLIVGGRLADRLGRRRTLLLGLLALVVTSVAAGFAPSAQVLIGWRLAQGAAAALVMPASLAVIAADVVPGSRDLAAGIWTTSLAVALALGPMVGGVLAEHLHWSWIFFLHLPVGALTMALAHAALPSAAPRQRLRLRELDPVGLLLATLVLAGISFVLVEGQRLGFGHPLVVSAGLVALAALPVLIAVEQRVDDPMLDIGLFRNRVFTGGTAAQVLWGLGVNGMSLYTSLFLQEVLGFSPSTAGLVFIPLAVAMVVCVAFVPGLASWFGARWTVTAGMTLVAAGLAWLSFAQADFGVLELLPSLVTIGVGSALITPLTSTVLSSVAEEGAGVASAMIGAAREASGVLGIAVVGVVISIAGSHDGGAAFHQGYAVGLRVAAALVLLGAVATAATLVPNSRRSTPAELTRPS